MGEKIVLHEVSGALQPQRERKRIISSSRGGTEIRGISEIATAQEGRVEGEGTPFLLGTKGRRVLTPGGDPLPKRTERAQLKKVYRGEKGHQLFQGLRDTEKKHIRGVCH